VKSVSDYEIRAPRGRTRIQSVSRGCQLLLWLAGRAQGATAKEVAYANGLSLSTTYHLLNTLADHGLLAKDAKRRYRLGRGTATLARAYLGGAPVPEALLRGLRELATRTQETVFLADWGDHEIRVVAAVEGTHLLRVADVIHGPYDDANARANGKVLLAYAPPELRQAYLREHPLPRRTSRTICDRTELLEELARVRARGYAYDEEEFVEGVCCVAAPLLADDGVVVAAFSVSVPTTRFATSRADLTETLLDVVAGLDPRAG
jgi:IclR family acetate operon transcriptional repressor